MTEHEIDWPTSKAQLRVLDQLGCGSHSPIMAKSTRDTLLRKGLIVRMESEHRPFLGGPHHDDRALSDAVGGALRLVFDLRRRRRARLAHEDPMTTNKTGMLRQFEKPVRLGTHEVSYCVTSEGGRVSKRMVVR